MILESVVPLPPKAVPLLDVVGRVIAEDIRAPWDMPRWDNSAMESFFSSLKTERTARKVYRTRDAARADVFDYIERFYNPRCGHSTLGYVNPVEFEAQARRA